MLNKVFLIIFINTLFCLKLYSQSTTYNVFELSYLYDEARFAEIINQTENLLKKKKELVRNQLVEIHKYRALAFFNLGQQDSSRINFFSVLGLDKTHSLNPVTTSPKIISFFNDIKNNFETNIDQGKILTYNNYIFVEDIRPFAALRSFALPGWGQHYKSQTTKGYVINGIFTLAAAASGISYLRERKLREDYLAATNASKIKSLYNDYNTMSKTRRILQYSIIVIWAYSIVDALYDPYTPYISIENDTITLSYNFSF